MRSARDSAANERAEKELFTSAWDLCRRTRRNSLSWPTAMMLPKLKMQKIGAEVSPEAHPKSAGGYGG